MASLAFAVESNEREKERESGKGGKERGETKRKRDDKISCVNGQYNLRAPASIIKALHSKVIKKKI